MQRLLYIFGTIAGLAIVMLIFAKDITATGIWYYTVFQERANLALLNSVPNPITLAPNAPATTSQPLLFDGLTVPIPFTATFYGPEGDVARSDTYTLGIAKQQNLKDILVVESEGADTLCLALAHLTNLTDPCSTRQRFHEAVAAFTPSAVSLFSSREDKLTGAILLPFKAAITPRLVESFATDAISGFIVAGEQPATYAVTFFTADDRAYNLVMTNTDVATLHYVLTTIK